jgi:hypothetical protein
MATLSFPIKKLSKYYEFYVSFIKSVFEVAGEPVVLDPTLNYIVPAAFYVKINGKLAFIDLSDFHDEYNYKIEGGDWVKQNKFYEPENMAVPVFKRSMKVGVKYADNVFPFGPFYVANNKTSEDLNILMSIGNIYDPLKGTQILNTNRVWAGALITRKSAFANIDVNKLLPEVSFDDSRLPLHQHWHRLGGCISTLNISGAYYTSQDIGAIEAMFLGICGISNNFDIQLPFNNRLQHGTHYIHILDDYSNINECLNYPYENRAICKDMGDAAYELMIKTCSPKALVKWFSQVVEEYYE